MRGEQINRYSSKALIVLSITALLCVLSGYFQPPQADEGSAAHIFQLSIVALVPTILLFVATADWKRPWRTGRPLVFTAAVVVLAFMALYYLEHRFYLAHYR
jgi:cytochrome bd-type quinol oxidase subunit 2